jgi:hypothetical protein
LSSYKLGQALQVHKDMGMRFDDFRQLATLILMDKNIDLFEQLLAAHREGGEKHHELRAYDARLLLLRGKDTEAAQQLAACLKDRSRNEQQTITSVFLSDLAGFDLVVQAYRCVPDKVAAFSHQMWRYRNQERIKEYEQLIQEHAKHHPNDPRLLEERAELHMLRGDFALAEAHFTRAFRGKKQPIGAARFGLIRARIQLGKAIETYQELGANTLAFQDIANQCVHLKNADQLESLLAAHRKAFPKIAKEAMWEMDIHWLRKDYAKTVADIKANNGALLKSNTSKWKAESYLIRSLVRSNKSKEAVQEAELLNKQKFGPRTLLALALASTGDVKRTMEYLENESSDRFLIEDSYHDEDLGPILRSEAYRDLQQRFPSPPAQPKLKLP